MLDVSKDNTSRKRERSRSQKIRRAVRRHEERVTAPAGRSGNSRRKEGGSSGSRQKAGNTSAAPRKGR